MPDGTPLRSWWHARHFGPVVGREHADRHPAGPNLADVTSFHDPAARTIRPGWAGERFDLHACVAALFSMRITDVDKAA